MTFEPTDDEIHLIGEAVAVAAHHHERTVGGQRLEMALQSGLLVARNVEHADQLSCGGRMVDLLADLAQKVVAGEHREF